MFKNPLILLLILSFPIAFILSCDQLAGSDASGNNDVGSGDEWTDLSTGLTWEATPGSGFVAWPDAKAYCDQLVIDGHDDWRLPTISELRTLIRGCDDTISSGSCGVTDLCTEVACQGVSCYSCDYGDGPYQGCFSASELDEGCDYYWSSTQVADAEFRAWAVGFTSGFVYKPRIFYAFHGRCVR